jgi:hypothetical protein
MSGVERLVTHIQLTDRFTNGNVLSLEEFFNGFFIIHLYYIYFFSGWFEEIYFIWGIFGVKGAFFWILWGLWIVMIFFF